MMRNSKAHLPAKLTRRRFVKAAGATTMMFGAGFGPAIAQQRNISFTLPWVPEGPNLMAFVAKAKGYWSKASLNVEIAKGSGSVGAAQAIGNGQFPFGISAAPAGLQQAALGLPIVQISCCAYDAFMSVIALRDGGILAPKDLEGKKFAGTTRSGEFPFLPAFAANAGVDLSKVEVLQVDPNVRQRLLIENQVSAISGFASTIIPPMVTNGIATRIILFSKYNLPLYGNALFTQQSLLEKEPELCRAIAEGLNEAIKFVLLDPEGSLDIFFKANPEMALAKGAREQTKLSLDFYRYSMVHEAAIKNGIGYSPSADYEKMTDLVMKYVAPDGKRPDLAKAVSNKFAGGVTLTGPEWDKVKASLSDVQKLLV